MNTQVQHDMTRQGRGSWCLALRSNVNCQWSSVYPATKHL